MDATNDFKLRRFAMNAASQNPRQQR